MKLIYQNFDGLDITFQGALPENILEQLVKAREQAQKEKREVLMHIEPESIPVMVAETCAKGGYKYRFDTGIDGEVWFIAHSIKRDGWNIRVSVKSLALALHGYEGVKERILNRLAALEAKGLARRDDDGALTEMPLERISRFDYCFDFVMGKEFMPRPECFVAHARCGKHRHASQETYDASTGDKVNTIRIGEMPGRQATIYDKVLEIKSSAKQYWWDIWGLNKDSFKETIWRVEVRAGKKELDQWSLKRFKDFERKAGDVIADTLKVIRYTEPLKDDSNRSRWPDAAIWRECLKASFKALAPYSSGACREKIVTDYRDAIISRYKDCLIGTAIGCAAAQGRDVSELPAVLDEVHDAIAALAREDISILIKKHARAEERFRFLDSVI